MIARIIKITPTAVLGNVLCELHKQDLAKIRHNTGSCRLLSKEDHIDIIVNCIDIYTLRVENDFAGGVNIYSKDLDSSTLEVLVASIENGKEVLLDIAQ